MDELGGSSETVKVKSSLFHRHDWGRDSCSFVELVLFLWFPLSLNRDFSYSAVSVLHLIAQSHIMKLQSLAVHFHT